MKLLPQSSSRIITQPQTELTTTEALLHPVHLKAQAALPVDAKNHADALVHSTEKALAEHGSKVAEGERRAIEDALSDLREALKGDDAEAIKAKTNTLAQASMKLGEAMYAQQAEADAAKHAAKDDVVDAEFTEVDDDKKKSA